MSGDSDKLDDFYAALRVGVRVKTFLHRYEETIRFIHSNGLTADFRLGRGRVKTLRDEVAPTARFARKFAESDDEIRFALDNTYPDCVICCGDGSERHIEVTVAQALKRLHTMMELNERGTGRGFIAVAEDAQHQVFTDAMAQEPAAYSTEEAVRCIQRDIELRAQRKKFHQGDTLLIEVDFEILPLIRWKELLAQLTENVSGLRFREVYLTGRGDDGDIALKLK